MRDAGGDQRDCKAEVGKLLHLERDARNQERQHPQCLCDGEFNEVREHVCDERRQQLPARGITHRARGRTRTSVRRRPPARETPSEMQRRKSDLLQDQRRASTDPRFLELTQHHASVRGFLGGCIHDGEHERRRDKQPERSGESLIRPGRPAGPLAVPRFSRLPFSEAATVPIDGDAAPTHAWSRAAAGDFAREKPAHEL